MLIESLKRKPYPKALAIRAVARLRSPRVPARRHNVAMLHLGRCGSTVLADLLRQHRGIHWDGETLQRYAAYEVNRALGAPLSALKVRMNAAGAQDFGFETKILWEYHLVTAGLPLETYIQFLRQVGFDRFIVVKRRNYLRWAASETIAERTRQWHQRGAATKRNEPVALELEQFCIDGSCKPLHNWFKEFDLLYGKLDSLLGSEERLHLEYEADIEPDPTRAYERVCKFLGYETQHVVVRLTRTNPFPLDELLTNMAEVRRHLEHTPYAGFLPSDWPNETP